MRARSRTFAEPDLSERNRSIEELARHCHAAARESSLFLTISRSNSCTQLLQLGRNFARTIAWPQPW